MRHFFISLTALGLLFGLAKASPRTGDEAAAIIDKAIKAHGIKGKEDKNLGLRGKNKGTLHVMGLDLEFTQEITIQTPDKFKDNLSLDFMGQMVNVITVYNGKEGWIKAAGMDVEITKEIMAEFKEVVHMQQLSQGMFAKDKGLTFSLLGQAKVNDKPAVGIKVSKKGQKDIDFYFDKTTGLIAKIERRAFDSQSGMEVAEERIITEYKDADGRKVAKKVEIRRDGMPLLEAEVLELKFVDRIDDGEFAKPG